MATHHVPFLHLVRREARSSARDRKPVPFTSRDTHGMSAHAEANFWLFMLAPAIIALTIVAVSWLSVRSFGG